MLMTKLNNYNAHIQWDSEATDPSGSAKVKLPDGSVVEVRRVSTRSEYRVKNGPLSVGSTEYFYGDARFDSFDALMQKGLGLTKQ